MAMDELDQMLAEGQQQIDNMNAANKARLEKFKEDDEARRKRRVARYAKGGVVAAPSHHKNGLAGSQPLRGAYSKAARGR